MTTPRLASAGLPLLNRETADGWIHIVPKGELPNAEAGVTQVLDLANLRGDAARLGHRWTGLYGGEEHFIYDAEKSSEASWWGKEFEKREGGSATGMSPLLGFSARSTRVHFPAST